MAPVLIGTGAAILTVVRFGDTPRVHAEYLPGSTIGRADTIFWGWAQAGQAVLALLVALALQVAVNYANDYSDGIRGTDDDRVGPFRLTGSGAAEPAQVKAAAFAAFGVAAVAGLALIAWSGHWWLLAVGVLCILGAWYYTGGRRPYGYSGLGEVSVFVFFGLVATLGTTYTQIGAITAVAVLGAIGTGALACAVMVANNLRDEPKDALVGKNTLAVRLGAARTRTFFAVLIGTPFVLTLAIAPSAGWALIALAALPLARGPLQAVLGGREGAGLLPALAGTGRLDLVWSALLAIGLVLSGPVF
ncbi:1,4-dihydroxy-2-naphthoate polyprenyltransferase [Spongisporangium articulatum]|uniref:1,4-dihydroxy-2-naphthoate octaprenyltransferase n=1 Tax=Spongisporangium articulatum TaxID=3362603 RepID=A0ABW8APE5_9ACTN